MRDIAADAPYGNKWHVEDHPGMEEGWSSKGSLHPQPIEQQFINQSADQKIEGGPLCSIRWLAGVAFVWVGKVTFQNVLKWCLHKIIFKILIPYKSDQITSILLFLKCNYWPQPTVELSWCK